MAARRRTDYRYEDGRRPTWEAIRQHVLAIQPECVLCGAPSVEVDHIWPLYYGGDDRRGNLQALCVACNRAKGNLVDPEKATLDQLDAAVQAVVERAIAAVDDLDRFLSPLIASVLANPSGEGISDLRFAKSLLGILCGDASRWYDLVTETLGEVDDRGSAKDLLALCALMGGRA